ncbi:hypothetical protein FGU71_09235 [Erythrobacter insulae]|uniref:Uncharacterized protein n=1 Tax=Erythrobacter insulae TaxID=2584124 RepID=A0A547PD02_9SPHN|nr:hypothetical protein [Erythrobacter insulae]TRD12023.1 hypothetical protein FGU71_09235 [Erythrobacter insulae]
MTFTTLVIALAAANPAVDAPTNDAPATAELGAASLVQGKSASAIQTIEPQLDETPHDPALLINMGIAFAQTGDDAKARSLFKAAMSSPEHFELETASGSTIDSRRLARRAIAMLDRGEFRPANSRLVLAE